ncbi:helix-turn-helix domain-containing protein [Nitratireductor sp. GCM10026969]|uniref:helix-turn-helix domain-containing protein n=1 Tax=Nitratireductor sp. GCM10026969 TaxID=3252645 RepID=UPI00361D2148
MSTRADESGKAMVGSAVLRSIFDSSGIPPREAFALWQEQLDHLAEARLVKEPEGFHARAEAVVLDRLVVGSIQNTAYAYDRSRFRIARDGIDHYMLQFYKKGRMICRITGTGEAIKPGDMILADMANPESVVILDIDVVNLVVPRALLAPLLVEPDAHGLRHFSGNDVLVKLLFDHVTALYAQSHHIAVEQAVALVPSLLELSAAAINGAVGDETRQGVSSALRQAICRYIGDHALEFGLSPQQIAAQFGISARKLSYLFQEDGGIATYIQGERLRLARLALMDPAQRGRTIAEIAEAHGFAHRTSFIRAFERTYSLTPSQQRAIAAGRRSADKDALSRASPIKWIGRF